MEFEWDRKKAATNKQKHGVTFQEAATVFGAPLAITFADPVILLMKSDASLLASRDLTDCQSYPMQSARIG